jgi:hypothetical protein
MANTSLFTAYTDSNWQGVTVAVGAGQEVGTALGVDVDGFINRLRWYRRTTHPADVPVALSLWDRVSHNRLAGTSTVPDSGAVGWQEWVLPVSYPVIAGQGLVVSGSYPFNQERSQDLNLAHQPTPGAHLAFASSQFQYVNGATLQYPESLANSLAGIDVAFDTTAEHPGTPPSTATEFQDWISLSLNTHGADSAPIANHTILAGLATEIGTASAPAMRADVKTIITALATAVSLVTGLEQLLRPGGVGPPSSVIKADGTTAIAQHDAMISTLAAINALVTSNNLALLPPAFPTESWTLDDEDDFTDEVAVNTPADLYVVTFSTLPASISPTDVAGVAWWPRLAWWAELDGTQLGQRGFLDFTENQIRAGRRLAGLLLRAKRGASGHWQAWTLA